MNNSHKLKLGLGLAVISLVILSSVSLANGAFVDLFDSVFGDEAEDDEDGDDGDDGGAGGSSSSTSQTTTETTPNTLSDTLFGTPRSILIFIILILALLILSQSFLARTQPQRGRKRKITHKSTSKTKKHPIKKGGNRKRAY